MGIMDGLDSMSKAELLLLCEKHKLDGGKTISQMRFVLKKFFEQNDESDAKKLKVDPLALKPAVAAAVPAANAPTVCPRGEHCPHLHSITHRLAQKHGGDFRDTPFTCRDGMSCTKLHDKEHLKKYAHQDGADQVCPQGADCPELHIMDHRKKLEHPGFRLLPVLCRDGMQCVNLKDKSHLMKYAHERATPTTSSVTTIPDVAAVLPPAVPTPPAPAAPAVPASKATAGAAPQKLSSSIATDIYANKTLDDFPLDLAPAPVLKPVAKDSEEFWDLEEKFNANLQGRNEDYVEKRIKGGKKPIRFVLTGAEEILNETLQARFEIKKRMMVQAERDSKDCRERPSFHGTHPKNIASIIRTGLLRFKHPLNPCKAQVDDGYFGTNKKGVYVSRYADYTLKYSNRVCAVEPKDEVKTIMFRTIPGKAKHIEKLCGPIDPTPGFDCHSSPTFLEWYLFDEAQACPQYVLTVRAVEDTRTAADDE